MKAIIISDPGCEIEHITQQTEIEQAD